MNETLTTFLDIAAALTGIRAVPDILHHPADSNVETLKIPGLFQTQAYTCGFVAGLMILRYFKPGADAERFYGRVRPNVNTGTSQRKLMAALREQGIAVTWRSGLDFDGVATAIGKGRPMAVLVRTGIRRQFHWVVVYGVGRRPRRVYVAANGLPLLSQKEYGWREFRMSLWAPAGFALVCSKRKRTRA